MHGKNCSTTTQIHQLFVLPFGFSHHPGLRQYSAIGNNKAFTNFTLVTRLILLYFHTAVNPPMVAIAAVILLHIISLYSLWKIHAIIGESVYLRRRCVLCV